MDKNDLKLIRPDLGKEIQVVIVKMPNLSLYLQLSRFVKPHFKINVGRQIIRVFINGGPGGTGVSIL